MVDAFSLRACVTELFALSSDRPVPGGRFTVIVAPAPTDSAPSAEVVNFTTYVVSAPAAIEGGAMATLT